MRYCNRLLYSVLLLSFFAAPALGDDMGPIDAVIKSFETVLIDGTLESTLINGAKFLFYCLAVIQISWMVGMELLCGAGSMQSVIACIVRQSLHVAFFYLLLVPTTLVGSNNILGVIVRGVEQLGIRVSGVSDFGTIFSAGIKVCAIIWKQIHGSFSVLALASSIGAYVVGALCTVIILLSFALASLTVVLTLCRTYVATSITVFYLGFGGCSYTKDIALNALRAAFVAGMELFTLYVLAGAGINLFSNVPAWVGTNINSENIFTATYALTAAAVIFAGLIKWLPGYVSGIINGSSGSGGGASSLPGVMGAAAMIASAGAAGIGGMAGAAVGGFHGAAAGGGAGGVGSILKGAASGMYSGSKGGFQQMFRNAGIDSLRGQQVKPPSDGGMPGMPDFNNITGTQSSSDGTGTRPSSPSDSAGTPSQTNDAGLNQRVDVPQEDGDKKA